VGAAATRLELGTDAADELTGTYRGVQLFSFLPYQLLMSVSFVLFPMLARARAEKNQAAVATYTRAGVRIAFVLTGLVSGTISSLAPHVLRFAYKSTAIWQQGGPVLRIMALGMGSFALLGISSTALTSLGRERVSAALTAVAVVVVGTGCSLVAPNAAFGADMLVRTALSTSTALGLCAVVAAMVLRREAGAFVALATLARVLVAVAITVVVGAQMPWVSKPMVLVQGVAMASLYVAVLVVTGELGKQDLGQVKKVLGKG